MIDFVMKLIGLDVGDVASTAVKGVADYQIAKLVLTGVSGGMALVFFSGFLAWKLQQADQNEDSKFSWKSITGVMAALVDLGIFALGAFIVVLAVWRGMKG